MSAILKNLPYSSPLAKHLHHFYQEASKTITYDCVFSGLEAAFYKCAEKTSDRAGDLVLLTNGLATKYFIHLQVFFTSINSYYTLYTVLAVVEKIGNPTLTAASSYFLPIGIAIGILFGTHTFYMYYYKKAPIESLNKTIKSSTQTFSRFIQIINVISSFSLAYLSANRASLVLKASFNAYSFLKNKNNSKPQPTQDSISTKAQEKNGDWIKDRQGNRIIEEAEKPTHINYKKLLNRKEQKQFKKNQRIFEKVHAIYNTIQAQLSLLQQIPEFAPAITGIKNILVVSDVFFTYQTCYFLFSNRRFQKLTWKHRISIVALAYFPFLISRYFQAQKADLPSLTKDGIQVEWEASSSIVNTIRLTSSIALAFYSKAHQAFNFTSIVTQMVSLAVDLSVPWLKISQLNLSTPFREVTNTSLQSSVLVSSIAARDQNILKTIISNVIELQKKALFKERYSWFIRDKSVFLSYNPIKINDIREYIFKPYLWNLNGKAIYKGGKLSLHFNKSSS